MLFSQLPEEQEAAFHGCPGDDPVSRQLQMFITRCSEISMESIIVVDLYDHGIWIHEVDRN